MTQYAGPRRKPRGNTVGKSIDVRLSPPEHDSLLRRARAEHRTVSSTARNYMLAGMRAGDKAPGTQLSQDTCQ